MNRGLCTRLRALAPAMAAVSLWCGAPRSVAAQPPAPAAGCAEEPAFYETHGFTVREIRLESPFDFFRLVRRTLDEATPRLPQKIGAPYEGRQVTDGLPVLETALGSLSEGVASPVRLSVAVAEIVDCQTTQPGSGSLVVIYRVYSSRFPLTFTRTFETAPRVEANPAEGASLTDATFLRFTPTVSYTRTSKLSAGAAAQLSHVGPIDRLDGRAAVSSRLRTADVTAARSRALDAAGALTIDWRGSYRYHHLPLTAGARTTSVATGELSVVRADLPLGGLVRFGAALEGGRASSELPVVTLPADTVAAATLFSVKAYAGTSWQIPRQSFNLSYGFQASATGEGVGGGFRKHLFDAASRTRLLPFKHRPWEVDARLTAGWISNGGRLPLSERFFGGNVPEEFLPSSNWSIRANPLIRSFAQSELNQAGAGAMAGGERFVAFNLMFAPTIWGRPLMPRELLETAGFQEKIDGQWQGAEFTLATQFASETPVVKTFVATEVKGIEAALTPGLEALEARFAGLASGASAPVAERLQACETELDTVLFSLPDIKPDNPADALTRFLALAPSGRAIDRVLACASDPLLGGASPPGPDVTVGIREAQARMQKGIALIDEGGSLVRAKATLAPAHRVLNSFLGELNIASVSPVFLFDAARLGPQPTTSALGFRYALGAGIRVSLVNLVHLTAAYAWNPDRRQGEKRGAVLVSLDVSEFLF